MRKLFFMWVAVVSTPAAFALEIAVSKQAVTVSNVTRGGGIVLFSCGRAPLSRGTAVKPRADVLRDDDHDGIVQFTPPGGVELRSVWVAVDESSGNTATGARSEFPLIVKPLGDDNLRKDVEQEVATMAMDLPRLLVLLVRPGTGAWIEAVFDGETGDHGGANGRVQLSFEELRTIEGKDKAPKHLKKDDAVVAIDPGHLDVFVAQVGK